ncbi:MAG TPA: hypothetical protein VGJ80_07570 [Gemmatimonadales bacterium]|jgi:hypothetical protein
MRRFIVLSTLILAAACYHGPSLQDFGPALWPQGINADLQLDSISVEGELLEVQDSSLIVLTYLSKVVSVPVRSIQRGRFGKLGDLLPPDIDQKSALAKLRNFSRFPAGLPPELRARLLAAYGQTAVDVVR